MKHLFASIVCLFLCACAESPGELTPKLDVASISTGTKSSITEFVFAAQPASGGSFLFPSACFPNNCLVAASCGFSATTATNFNLVLPLSGGVVNFPDNQNFTLTACGLNATHDVVASGSKSIPNTTGTSPTIVMSETILTDCKNILPPKCP